MLHNSNVIDIIQEIENEVNTPIYHTLSKAENFIINTETMRDMMHAYYVRVGKPLQAKAIRECGTFLMFKQYKNPEATAQLTRANFCKNPLCPMCAWRKHIKNNNVMVRAVSEIPGKFSHLVLAIPNTQNITRERLMLLKERAVSFVKYYMLCDNYYSSLEIVASERGYHPHIHMLLNTDEYFDVSAEWIKKMSTKWMHHFSRKDTEVYDREYNGYTFFVRGIQGDDIDLHNALLELTKYVVKAETRISEEHTAQMCEAIRGVRKSSAGGTFKEGIRRGKCDALVETEEFFRNLSRYDWEYQIYNYINGKYVKR